MLNNILRALSPSDRALIERHLHERPLSAGLVLAEPGDELETVYFLERGVVSYSVELKDGLSILTHLVGFDGMVGAEQARDHKTSTNKIVVQISGTAFTTSRGALRDVLDRRPSVRQLFAAYEQFVIAKIQQTAACNATHTVKQRSARWLLRMRDLTGDDLPITQETLANMMAVRRTSVTGVMLEMGEAIDRHRGKVRVTGPKRLEAVSCECHAAVRKSYQDLLCAHWPP